jgi:hypothetical protein
VGLTARWKRVINMSSETEALPEVLELKPAGKGSITKTGGSPQPTAWEFYADGFLILQPSDYEMTYAYSTPYGPTLFLSTSDESQSWYVNESFNSALKAPAELAGSWKSAEPSVELKISADGSLLFANNGKQYKGTATAAGAIMVVRQGGDTYYLSFHREEDTLYLGYRAVPFLPEDIQMLTFTLQK